jgi:hypothetical protein
MKTNGNKIKIILIIGIMLFGLLLLSSPNIFAKENPDEQEPSTQLTKLIIQNYMKGLCSDNEGVRKSCITFAGRYKISEAIDTLSDQLQKENNPEIQGLISIALNEITNGNDLNSIAEKSK